MEKYEKYDRMDKIKHAMALDRHCMKVNIVTRESYKTWIEDVYQCFNDWVERMNGCLKRHQISEEKDRIICYQDDSVISYQVGKIETTYGEFTRRKMENAFKRLRAGEGEGFAVSAIKEIKYRFNEMLLTDLLDISQMCVAYDQKEKLGFFQLAFNNLLLPDLYTQREVEELTRQLCVKMHAMSGLLTREGSAGMGDTTPMEQRALKWSPEKCKHFSHKLRGYGHGNILTKEHIEQLGGIERIKAEAPCAIVQEMEIGGEPAVYLQLQEDFFGDDTEALKALRRYLEPLLYPLMPDDIVTAHKNMVETYYRSLKGPGRPTYPEDGPPTLDEILDKYIYIPGLCLFDEEMEEIARLEEMSLEEIHEMQMEEMKKEGYVFMETKTGMKEPYKNVELEITEEADPVALPITIEFDRMTVKKRRTLTKLLDAWALMALNNGFSEEGAHDISEIEWDGNRCGFGCDLSGGFEEALNALERVVNWFCATEELKITRFITKPMKDFEEEEE